MISIKLTHPLASPSLNQTNSPPFIPLSASQRGGVICFYSNYTSAFNFIPETDTFKQIILPASPLFAKQRGAGGEFVGILREGKLTANSAVNESTTPSRN